MQMYKFLLEMEERSEGGTYLLNKRHSPKLVRNQIQFEILQFKFVKLLEKNAMFWSTLWVVLSTCHNCHRLVHL